MNNTSSSLLVLFFLLAALTFVSAGTLYGLSEQVQLLSIDPKTFKNVTIGKPISELQSQSLASVDKTKGIYYFIGYDSSTQSSELTGLSLKTGDIVFNYPLPFQSSGFIGVGEFVAVDPKSGQVIAIGLTGTTTHSMLRIDVDTKSHKVLATFPDGNLLGAFASYDATNDVVWIDSVPVGGNTLHIQGFNAQTGKLVKDLEDTLALETLSWDSKTGLCFGIGLKVINSTTFVRTLVSFSGKTFEFKEIAVLDGFAIISSSIAALDPVGRTLFVFLTHYDNFDTFYLVSVNIDTGKVVSAPLACTADALCPWSLEYV